MFWSTNLFFPTSRFCRVDDDLKRPSSPIEKIKSFFRKSKENTSANDHGNNQSNVNTNNNINNKTINNNISVSNNPSTITSNSAYPHLRDYVRYSPVESQPSTTNRF